MKHIPELDHATIIGTRVNYHPIIREDGRKLGTIETTITSEAWQIGHGEYVIKIDGHVGAVSIKHIDIIKQVIPV